MPIKITNVTTVKKFFKKSLLALSMHIQHKTNKNKRNINSHIISLLSVKFQRASILKYILPYFIVKN